MYMLTNHTHLLLAETGGGRSLKGNSVESEGNGGIGRNEMWKICGWWPYSDGVEGNEKHTHIRNTQVNNGALLTTAAKQRTVIATNNCICA